MAKNLKNKKLHFRKENFTSKAHTWDQTTSNCRPTVMSTQWMGKAGGEKLRSS